MFVLIKENNQVWLIKALEHRKMQMSLHEQMKTKVNFRWESSVHHCWTLEMNILIAFLNIENYTDYFSSHCFKTVGIFFATYNSMTAVLNRFYQKHLNETSFLHFNSWKYYYNDSPETDIRKSVS